MAERDRAAVQFGEIADDGESEAGTGSSLIGAHSPLYHEVAHGRIKA
jgi:hypothetical protein